MIQHDTTSCRWLPLVASGCQLFQQLASRSELLRHPSMDARKPCRPEINSLPINLTAGGFFDTETSHSQIITNHPHINGLDVLLQSFTVDLNETTRVGRDINHSAELPSASPSAKRRPNVAVPAVEASSERPGSRPSWFKTLALVNPQNSL